MATRATAGSSGREASRTRSPIFASSTTPEGRSNLSLLDTGGAALVISQFTLYADYRRGRRPSFSDAADPGPAAALVDEFREALDAWASPRRPGISGPT